jgi:hypothetical protein
MNNDVVATQATRRACCRLSYDISPGSGQPITGIRGPEFVVRAAAR